MNESSPWPPPLIQLEHYGGDWRQYISAVYSAFHHDFIRTQPQLDGLWVRCRRDPICDGKEAGFWHCTSEGQDEANRAPDLRRCERIKWIRAIIENAGGSDVDRWTNRRGSEVRHPLWFREEFLVVLAERIRSRDAFRYYQLITAYCTQEENRKRGLRRERDAHRNG